jgi:hypothetical protein
VIGDRNACVRNDRVTMKVEQGTLVADDNRPSAEREEHLRAYFARKRLVGVRSAVVIVPVAGCVAIWSPSLGLDLATGGICGFVNMLLVMRNNERLVERARSLRAYGLRNTLRMVTICLVPVVAAAHQPWWAMLVVVAGLFAPLVLYSFECRREMSTE